MPQFKKPKVSKTTAKRRETVEWLSAYAKGKEAQRKRLEAELKKNRKKGKLKKQMQTQKNYLASKLGKKEKTTRIDPSGQKQREFRGYFDI